MGLSHPSLIYAPCVAVGVRGDKNEEQLFPIAALTREKILSIKQSDREEMDPSEPRSSGEAGSSSSRSARTPKSLSDQVANLTGKMDRVIKFYKKTEDWQFEMKMQMAHTMDQHERYYMYTFDFKEALVGIFRSNPFIERLDQYEFPSVFEYPSFVHLVF
ncbi:hypothetical protein M5K25_002412 [Dendrobium thyrsiflorum]|uniref:Uncharacterized protein n=1 Tax=Dendrobium thyrsiflorum TaxID=117978 RepID=A0ABD0VTX3_DENTH